MDEGEKEGGLFIPSWMFDIGLKGYELLVYAIIYFFTTKSEEKAFRGGGTYLQKYFNVKQQSIARVLKDLELKGYIEHKRTKKGYAYVAKITQGNITTKCCTDLQQNVVQDNNIDNNKIIKNEIKETNNINIISKEKKEEEATQTSILEKKPKEDTTMTKPTQEKKEEEATQTPLLKEKPKTDETKPNPTQEKKAYGDDLEKHVMLTEAEYNTLVKRFGEEFTKKCIEKLNNYIGKNPATYHRKYKSDYRCILMWVVRAVQEDDTVKMKNDFYKEKTKPKWGDSRMCQYDHSDDDDTEITGEELEEFRKTLPN